MAAKPPLPPRNVSTSTTITTDSTSFDHESDYQQRQYLSPSTSSPVSPVTSNHPPPYSVGLKDPRTSSTQSLRPVESAGESRRTLLLVYIHGFLGDETSFGSFPAHVHTLLTDVLRPSHVVYTKIYPRYKSRKNISIARDGLSNWSVLLSLQTYGD
jgi:hypothetical protein